MLQFAGSGMFGAILAIPNSRIAAPRGLLGFLINLVVVMLIFLLLVRSGEAAVGGAMGWILGMFLVRVYR
ncbi:MAG: hypothetical protein HYS83_01640 [Candidatus Blackburnbacteria bacterium]|nr:hypothetical protein [Candidatus Blackburnbacteria bacterium]